MLASFFFAGFECAAGWNVRRQRIDQVAATQHDRFADEDYARLRSVGLRAARDAIRWPVVDAGGRYDFRSAEPIAAAARRHRVQVVWDLFHFGYPDDLDPFSGALPERFAAYCRAAARWVRERSDGPPWFTPINEPSYFAWAAGDRGLFAPHAAGRAPELKLQLVRAAIAGTNAIWSECPDARILTVDPICQVVAPQGRPDLEPHADHFNDVVVFEAWDMIAGRRAPELGGSPRHLGVVGLNYYWTNQWELGRPGIPLEDGDPRRARLRDLARRVYDRYGAPVMISETGHVGERRAGWIDEMATECEAMLASRLPLVGACLYPILSMPEWQDQEVWTSMGLWDLVRSGDVLERVPHGPAVRALEEAQMRVESLRTLVV